MRRSITIRDEDCRAVIRVNRIDAVIRESGLTTIYHNGLWVQTQTDIDVVIGLIDAVEEEIDNAQA